MEKSDEIVILADVRASLNAIRPQGQNVVPLQPHDRGKKCSIILFPLKARADPARN
ncbi:hypothetical protein [Rhizobium sp. C4]|uniref:hypothetical protein n=1 Tax=Rhizobium sp. C4 TaxID=1349800 RepID=UPI001E5D969A|nr:hypothetical protein [Rhizobium sp. C4]MCD2172784.1 hypothetical protein [Rhizobium sp. C4]